VSSVAIRRAREDEADALTALALRSKALWGYAPDQIAAWRAVLAMTPARIRTQEAHVAERDGALAGFYALSPAPAVRELDSLWVEPSCVGSGVGRALMRHAMDLARAAGAAALRIDADPNAERFYRACGARRVGEVAAPIAGAPQRVRPQLVLDVTGTGG
jgi:GNAT superfamily N-acetyltransferase